jgi:glycosyltransferase involved in cell wall biosynthesis
MECNFDRKNIRSKLGIGENKIAILYLGRLIKKKGLDVLISAFSKLVREKPTLNIKLIIAGEGPERKRLENLCNQLGLTSKTVFLGAVPEKYKKCIYKASDIFVYTPIIMEIPEEWPIAPFEAMSLGIPTIVSTAIGSMPDIQASVLGVRHGDVEALYRAIIRLIEDKTLRSYLSRLSVNTYSDLANLTHIKTELLYAMLRSFRDL